jgi:predicted phage baseplate assembly protein
LPASTFSAATPASAVPKPRIFVLDDQGESWAPLDDLLSTDEFTRAFVLEIERDNSAFLRFGDGQYGDMPESGASFRARYRAGNGSAGNVGRDVLAHILLPSNTPPFDTKLITEVRNPLPAAGGVDPETMGHIRQVAPWAFRTQLRAVTEDDYGVMAQGIPGIRDAKGTLRWTGSWYTAFVSLEPSTDKPPDPLLVTNTERQLNLVRMAGVDLDVEPAQIVGIRIEMNVCVDPEHFQSDVGDAIMRRFTVGDLCNGLSGILNPENFTFGQTIYVSPLVAAAQEVEGVSSAVITVFQRMDDSSSDGTAQGYLTMGRLEIARCDSDPNRLDHGIFVLHLDGGK